MKFTIKDLGSDIQIYDEYNDESIFANIDEAEELWQQLMTVCHAHRRQEQSNEPRLNS